MTTMSSKAANDLSVLELLRLLNEKLGLECTRSREFRVSPAISVTSLELEIESLEARAHDVLKLIPSLRNMLRPVNRLPPEILPRIAQYVPDENASDTRSIIPLTHVCRYWRESMVSTPEIWVLISNKSKGLTALSLERSKAAPLEIELNMQDHGFIDFYLGNREFFNLLLPCIKNTGSFSFRGFSYTEELTQLFPNFPRSTPNLRSLTLHRAELLNRPDQRVDPFKPLPSTLRYLSLNDLPLYPSFLCLRSLTELDLTNERFNLHIDTLLNFLKGNHSLEIATLRIRFAEPSLRGSQLGTAIVSRLRYLSIRCGNVADCEALVSGIALQSGAHLEIEHGGYNTMLRRTLSVEHLSNLSPLTFMECRSYCRFIRLLGPNGALSLKALRGSEDPFSVFRLLPLSFTNVQEFRLEHRRPEGMSPSPPLDPIKFHPSFPPALETLAVDCETSLSHLFSILFSNPSSSPSLKTLAFLDCDLTEGFMEELTRYTSERKDTASARLHRVVITNSEGKFPSVTSIDALRKHVPVVDVQMSKELPKDLT